MSDSAQTSLRGAVDLSALTRPAPEAQSTNSAGEHASSQFVFEGTDANFSQFLELSQTVPVVVDLWAEWCAPCKQLSPILFSLAGEFGGKLAVVTIDVDQNPQLAQAFQAQSIPTVAALVAGQPVNLFVGALPEAQVREVFNQLLTLAQQHGVAGSLAVGGDATAEAEQPAEEPLPPHHAEAIEAIERGDYDTAMAEYRLAMAQDPHDEMAVAGLAQVSLLARLKDADTDAVRRAAADAPRDIDAALQVADLDVAGGHVSDAFDRLLELFAHADADDKSSIRKRLLEYFEAVGRDDARVARARARLANLLY